jgi:hypothetical protein
LKTKVTVFVQKFKRNGTLFELKVNKMLEVGARVIHRKWEERGAVFPYGNF